MDITIFGKMYHGKGVVVTGAGGFIGSHLAELLTRLGANVTAFVHYNSLGSFGWLRHSEVKNDMEVVFSPLRRPSGENHLKLSTKWSDASKMGIANEFRTSFKGVAVSQDTKRRLNKFGERIKMQFN